MINITNNESKVYFIYLDNIKTLILSNKANIIQEKWEIHAITLIIMLYPTNLEKSKSNNLKLMIKFKPINKINFKPILKPSLLKRNRKNLLLANLDKNNIHKRTILTTKI